MNMKSMRVTVSVLSILALSFCVVADAAHSGVREMLAPKSPYKNEKSSYQRLQVLPRMLIDHMLNDATKSILSATKERDVANVQRVLLDIYSGALSEADGIKALEALGAIHYFAKADAHAAGKGRVDGQLPGGLSESLKWDLASKKLEIIARVSMSNMEASKVEQLKQNVRDILADVYLKEIHPGEGIKALNQMGMPEETARSTIEKITDVLTKIVSGESLVFAHGKVEVQSAPAVANTDESAGVKPLFPFYSFFATDKDPYSYGKDIYRRDGLARVEFGNDGDAQHYFIYFERVYDRGPWIGVCIPASERHWMPRAGDINRWGAALGDSVGTKRKAGDIRIDPSHLTPDGYQPFVALKEPKEYGDPVDSAGEETLVVVAAGTADEHYVIFWKDKDGRAYGLKLRPEDRDRRLTATQKNAWEWKFRSPAISRLNPEQIVAVQNLFSPSIFYRDRATKSIDEGKLLNLLASLYLWEEIVPAVHWELIDLGMHPEAARNYMQLLLHELGRPEGDGPGGYMGQGLEEPMAKRWIAETLRSDSLVFSPDGQKVQMGRIAENGEVVRRELTPEELSQYADIIRVVRDSSAPEILRQEVRRLWQPKIPGFDKDFVLQEIGRTEIWITPNTFTIAGGYYAHAAFHYGQRKYAGGKRVAAMTAAQFAQDRAQEAMHHAYKDPAHHFIEHDQNHEEAMQALLDEHAEEVERERRDGRNIAIRSLMRLLQDTAGVVRRSLAYNMQVESEGDYTPLPKDGKVVIFVGERVFIESLQAVGDMLQKGSLPDRMREIFGPAMQNAPMYFISDAVLSQESNEELRRTILSDVKGGYMADGRSEINALDDSISDAMPREDGYQWGEKIERAVDGAVLGKYGDAYNKLKARPSVIVINIDDMDHAVHLRAALKSHAQDGNVRVVLIAGKDRTNAEGLVRPGKEVLEEYVKLLRLKSGVDYHAAITFKELQERPGFADVESALLDRLNELFADWAPSGKGIEAMDVGFINSGDNQTAIPLKTSPAGKGILEVTPRKPTASQVMDMRKVMGFTRLALHLRQVAGNENLTLKDLKPYFSADEWTEFVAAMASQGLASEDVKVMDYLQQPPAMPTSDADLNAAARSFKEVLLAA